MSTTSLDKYVDDDIFSSLLRYGLFVGAIFQLLCIGSVLFRTGTNNDEDAAEQKPLGINNGRLQKFRKQDKKKRR